MPKSSTSRVKGSPKIPGSGRKKDKPTGWERAQRELSRPASEVIDLSKSTVEDVIWYQIGRDRKSMWRLILWKYPELAEQGRYKDPIKLDLGLSDEFKRLITDKEGLELAKQLSRRVQSGMGQPGLDGDAPGS